MKQKKRLYFAFLAIGMLFVLSGCVDVANGVPTGKGWVYHYLFTPMSNLIKYFALDRGLGFGIAIIITVAIVRLFIMPLGIYQSWKAAYQSEKMNYLKPILDPIQERLKNSSSQADKLLAQQELIATQREYGVSLFGGIGCLPLIIQWPFFSAIYNAVLYTDGIKTATFLGQDLGNPSILFVVLAGLLYYLQGHLSLYHMDEMQKSQMKTMLLISPLSIVVFALFSPAGISLYWVVGGLFTILQQLIVNFGVRPYLKKKVEAEYAGRTLKPVSISGSEAPRPVKDVTPTSSSRSSAGNKRNAGKQRSRH